MVTGPRRTVGGVLERGRSRDGFVADDQVPGEDYSAEGLPTGHLIGGALRRGAWIWCGTAVAGMLIGLVFSVLFPPARQASTTILLTHNPLVEPQTTILTDVALAQSRTVAERARDSLRLPQSVDSFHAAYTVTQVTDRVLNISAGAPTSSQAVAQANAVAAAFLQVRAQALRAQQRLAVAAFRLQMTQTQLQVQSLSRQLAGLPAKLTTPARLAQSRRLQSQLSRAYNQLGTLENSESGLLQATALEIQDSEVVDPATPAVGQHRFLGPRALAAILYAGTGLIPGLVLGMGWVVVAALVSDRLRRRDDVAHALGAPVRLSVGRVGGRWWWPARRGLAAGGRDRQRVVAHLQEVVSARSDLALALVAVDDERAAALSLASLAVACAREGKQVVLADLCGGAPAARLLGAKGRGVGAVSVRGTRLTVAVPGVDAGVPAGPLRRGPVPAWQQSSRELPGGSDDGAAAGPLRRGPVPGWQQPSRELAAACASADVLLTLVSLDPSLGAEHLASWADEAVVMVAAGRSSWTKIHAVAEMIRLAGTPVVSAVLVDADKTDESIGIAPTPPAPAGSGLRMRSQ